MASLASLVRVSARQSACWRACKTCTIPAPMASGHTVCSGCRAGRPVGRRLPRAA